MAKRRKSNLGRPTGLTAAQSLARQEKIERLFDKYGSYKKVAEKMGMSYMAIYQRLNYYAA